MNSGALVDNPRVTVAMTTYNGATHLRETIDSILAQTFDQFEFLIVDDASKDDTRSIIGAYGDSRIRLVENERNLGISESRNRAIRLARGEYIAATDQDDLSARTRLERQVEYLDSHPETILVSSAVRLLEYGSGRTDPMPVFDEPRKLHFALFFGRHNVTYSSICARLDTLKKHELTFKPEFHYAEDYELYHRIAKVGSMVTLSEALVTYRLHGENNSIIRYETMSDNGRRFLQQAFQDLLGREFTGGEIERVWRVVVEKKPAQNMGELMAVGALLAESLNAFEERYPGKSSYADSVGELASEIWWSVVRASSREIGVNALQAFSSYSDLRSWSPSLAGRANTVLMSLFKSMGRKIF